MADDKSWVPDDYDAAIRQLTEEKDKLRKVLEDPKQRKERWQRRTQIIGDWATRTFSWSNDEVDDLRKAAGDEQWLFDPKLLKLDGWTRTDKDAWRAPESG